MTRLLSFERCRHEETSTRHEEQGDTGGRQEGISWHRRVKTIRAVSVAGWRSANQDGHERAEAQVRPEGDRSRPLATTAPPPGAPPGDGEGGREPTGKQAGGELRPAQPADEQAEEPIEADVGHAELAREPKREHQLEAGHEPPGDAGAAEHPPAVAQG